MPRPFKDDDFLCERCGYILNGLGPEADCPECGKPAWESHPDVRQGVAAQRSFSLWGQADTMIVGLFMPFTLWRELAISHESERVERKAILWSALIYSILIMLLVRPSIYSHTRENALVIPAIFVVYIIIISLLNEIERRGICFFSTRREWRITRDVSWAITSTSSVGWLAGAFIGLLNPFTLSAFFVRSSHSPPEINWNSFTIAMTISFVVGMLCFETLVYIGMRKMKFANPPEAAPEWSIEDAKRARGELDDSTEPEASDGDTM